MRKWTRIWITAAAAVLAIPSSAAARGPSVRVASLSEPPATSVAPGSAFTLRFDARRAGAGFKRGTLRFYASRSKKKTRTAQRLKATASLARLAKSTRLKGRVTLEAPATAGAFHIVACAEALKAGQGEHPTGGCTTTAGVLTVRQSANGGVPVAASAAPSAANPPADNASAGSGTPPAGATPGLDPATALSAKADPLNVTPVLDPTHAAGATIGTAGGTLTTTDANGTVYTLTIPAQALLGDETITMTPVSSIGGLPFDALVGAVDLAPDGLRLLEPATLQIAPATKPPVDQQAAFEYSGPGNDLHLAQLSQDDTKVELQLSHFTGGGLSKGTSDQMAAVVARTPVEYEAQFESLLAALDRTLRAHIIDYPTWLNAATTIGHQWYQHIVLPRLRGAETDDSLMEIAVSSFFAWARRFGGAGLYGDAFATEIADGYASVGRILQNAYDKSYVRCLAGSHGLEFERLLEISGFAGRSGFGELPDLLARLTRCARFTLDMKINLKGLTDPRFGAETLQASSHALLTFDDRGHASGPVPLTADAFNYFDPVCFKAPGAASQKTAGNADLTIDPNIVIEHEPDGTSKAVPHPRLSLLLDYGDMYTDSQCAVEAGQHGGGGLFFYRSQLHTDWAALEADATRRLRFDTWVFGAGDPFATLNLIDAVHQGNTISLTLHHTPAA